MLRSIAKGTKSWIGHLKVTESTSIGDLQVVSKDVGDKKQGKIKQKITKKTWIDPHIRQKWCTAFSIDNYLKIKTFLLFHPSFL